MGRLAKEIMTDITAMERGESAVTESPIGDRGEPRPPAGSPNGKILLRISRREHELLVREAAQEGVSLNHYLTEIVCARSRIGPAQVRGTRAHPKRPERSRKVTA